MFGRKFGATAATLAASVLLAGCASTGTAVNGSGAMVDPTATSTATSLPMVDVTALPNETGVVESTVIADGTAQISLLNYLIEEEKLAHDVYLTLGQIWGSRVFSNILQSEVSHQGQVLALLESRGLADPRSTEIGVFKNPELQKLYDELVAKGGASMTAAFEAGVAIEELDISDISDMLGKTLDSDVIATLERLRSASENHLRAFNRQL